MAPTIKAAWRAGSTDGRAGWRIQFAFDRDTIDRLKRVIPSRDREWNDEGSWWWVDLSREQGAIAVLPGLEAIMRQGVLF